MHRIQIFLRKDVKRKDFSSPLYAKIVNNSKKTRFPINIWVHPDLWDPKNQVVKGDSKETDDINLIISNARAKITDILVRARLSNEAIDSKKLIERYKQLDGGGMSVTDTSESFIGFARKHLEEIESSLAHGTWLRRKGILDKIEKYDPYVTFNKITPEWLRQYASHCRDYYNNGPGTIKKAMDTIRLFYRVGIRKGLTREDPFEHYKAPVHYPVISFLSEPELKKLIKLKKSSLLNDNEDLVLDAFLFMAFTGMHYTDAKQLNIEDIRDGIIHYRRQKTGVLVNVPLNNTSAEFVEKYSKGRYSGYLFQNFPTNQSVNRLIKIISAKAGIRKRVTAITARHTFATIFYRKTRDIGSLSRLLGHTSVKNTMIYIHLLKDDLVTGINVFNDFSL